MAMVLDKSHRWRVVAAHLGLIAFIALTVFPFLMVLSISLRPGNFAVGSIIPSDITLEHWKLALGLTHTRADGSVINPPFPVLLWLWNSVKVAAITAGLILALSTTSAYAFARMRFKGRSFALNALMLMQMFPAVLSLVAIYAIFETVGDSLPRFGINTHAGLILAYCGGIAMHAWTIKGYFDSIDRALDNAAAIDGATPWQTFRFVFLPLAVPIMAVVFVLAFIGTIIEYPIASVLLREEPNLTLAVGSKYYLYEQRYLWGDFAAAAVLSGLPITLVFLAAQRWIVSGLTSGGVKG